MFAVTYKILDNHDDNDDGDGEDGDDGVVKLGQHSVELFAVSRKNIHADFFSGGESTPGSRNIIQFVLLYLAVIKSLLPLQQHFMSCIAI